jgi:hypothetical protein
LFLRIRYGNVTRWKPPTDLSSETFPNGLFDATSFVPCCLQLIGDIYIPEQDEQCLYLNIFKPIVQSINSLLPVLVWVHGDAHRGGCSLQNIPLLFNGTNLIANSPPNQPVIIIRINYRLGVLADMYLTELIEEDPKWPTAGNSMYLDMLSALRWINKTIHDYGGDPTNVSLFGQSPGGLSVIDLGSVRGSSGLYRYDHILIDIQDQLLIIIYFPMYPPLSIKSGRYNNITLIMVNNDFKEPICFQHSDMTYNEALELITRSVEQKCISSIVDYYNLHSCSSIELLIIFVVVISLV